MASTAEDVSWEYAGRIGVDTGMVIVGGNGHDLVGSEWASLLESGRLRKINLPDGPA